MLTCLSCYEPMLEMIEGPQLKPILKSPPLSLIASQTLTNVTEQAKIFSSMSPRSTRSSSSFLNTDSKFQFQDTSNLLDTTQQNWSLWINQRAHIIIFNYNSLILWWKSFNGFSKTILKIFNHHINKFFFRSILAFNYHFF